MTRSAGLDRRPLRIDIVAKSVERKGVLIGEAKLRVLAHDGNRFMTESRDRISRLSFVSSYELIAPVLFITDASRTLTRSADMLVVPAREFFSMEKQT